LQFAATALRVRVPFGVAGSRVVPKVIQAVRDGYNRRGFSPRFLFSGKAGLGALCLLAVKLLKEYSNE
jgi:hypothetical protein